MVFGGKSDSWLVWGCLYSWYWNCYKTGTKPVLCSSSSLYQGGIGISLVLPQVISLVGSFLLVSTFVDTRWWRLVCQASGYDQALVECSSRQIRKVTIRKEVQKQMNSWLTAIHDAWKWTMLHCCAFIVTKILSEESWRFHCWLGP